MTNGKRTEWRILFGGVSQVAGKRWSTATEDTRTPYQRLKESRGWKRDDIKKVMGGSFLAGDGGKLGVEALERASFKRLAYGSCALSKRGY